jgi:hypothetical protein
MKKKRIDETYIWLAVVGFFLIFYAAFMVITAKDTRMLPKEIFGIKMFDKANNYFQDIYVEDPAHKNKLMESIDRVLKKNEHFGLGKKQVKFVINENFSENTIYIDKNFIIFGIGGEEKIKENLDNFINVCLKKRRNFIKNLSELYNIKPRVFKNHFFRAKSISEDGYAFYTDRKFIKYNINNIPVILKVSCVYYHDKEFYSILYYSLEAQEFSDKNQKKRMEKIGKFDNEKIIFNYKGL